MERYQIILAYDGTDFAGSQRQGRRRTVQLALEEALAALGWQGRSVLMAGRTDAGVHALGQAAAFDLSWRHSLSDLRKALNQSLPDDLAVIAVEKTRADFHPRYDAVERTYRYRLYFSPQRNPLEDRYAWRLWPEPDKALLEQAAFLLPGRHDFRAFGKAHEPGGTTIRHISLAEWQVEGKSAQFTVRGNAFLFHMVRRLVHAQVQAGSGKLRLDDFRCAVEQGQELPTGLAPARGLTLMEVRFAGSRQEAQLKLQNLM